MKFPDQYAQQRREETCGVAGNIFKFFLVIISLWFHIG